MVDAKIARHKRRHRSILIALTLAIALAAANIAAQTEPTSSGQITTLHLETNLIEIPVLVLTARRGKLPSPIAANQFAISLGGGPWVRPKYVRREGGDSIDLAIVIDTRKPQSHLLSQMSQALASLSPESLTPRDHVSIYVMGCSTVEIAANISTDSEHLHAAMEKTLLKQTNEIEADKKANCNLGDHLWDILAFVTHEMSTRPGRRTILAVTNGDDHNSVRTPEDLRTLAQENGVTIFGLNAALHPNAYIRTVPERMLSLVTESSGGVTMDLEGGKLNQELKLFIQMLRDRYIVQFPRPPDVKAGRTEFMVNVAGLNLFIRTAGKSVPLPEPPETEGKTRPDAIQ